jgi:phospholipid/cholesterol/gamma-HCH transport system substrate-binding protein
MPRSRPRHDDRNFVAIGLIALAIIAVLLFFGFTKDNPFSRGFRIQAQFESANSIRDNSPVRIAGVNVGKVVAIDAVEGSEAALLTLEIAEQGRPIHEDATAKIRPRIFLEGNFFVDLSPGTPGSPELGDGDTIKVTQTSTPVQLDEVLTLLTSDTREDLKDVLDELGTALMSQPTAAEDRRADPDTRGERAAKSLNDSLATAGPAYRSTSQVLDALLGTEPDRDLARLLDGTARTTAALARSEAVLQDLITNFNTTAAAFAAEEGNLRTSIATLPGVLEEANGALAELNEAFPPTRAFAREILPGVRETPATIDAALPWIAQARPLVSERELGGLLADLAPATASLARLTDGLLTLLPRVELASRCIYGNLLPTTEAVIEDEFPTGVENYKDFITALVGLAAESQNFDGNGQYVRFQTGSGAQTLSLGSSPNPFQRLFGRAALPPLGTRPAYPGKRSPYRPDAVCHEQTLPDLDGRAARGGNADGVIARQGGQGGQTTPVTSPTPPTLSAAPAGSIP